jgi:hypothetical protein
MGAQVPVIAVMGAAGVAIAALQPRSATDLAAGAAVWMAVARLPLGPGVAIGSATTLAVGLAAALGGSSAGAVLAAVLLCALLAHTLSGAAIQLEGARVLAERERAGERVRVAIDRASALVKDGLASAREAVGALRGEQLPGLEQLEAPVEGFRSDHGVEVELSVEGQKRARGGRARVGGNA